jgi:hypothetical protein
LLAEILEPRAVGYVLASTYYGSSSYRAATRPADYSCPHVQLPLSPYWRARRAWIHATLACCNILLHPTVGHICFPHPRSTDCKPLPLPCSSYINGLFLFCTAVTPLLASVYNAPKLSAVVQPLPRIPLSDYYRRHQRTLASSAKVRINIPFLRLTARYRSAVNTTNRYTTRRLLFSILHHVLRYVPNG